MHNVKKLRYKKKIKYLTITNKERYAHNGRRRIVLLGQKARVTAINFSIFYLSV